MDAKEMKTAYRFGAVNYLGWIIIRYGFEDKYGRCKSAVEIVHRQTGNTQRIDRNGKGYGYESRKKSLEDAKSVIREIRRLNKIEFS